MTTTVTGAPAHRRCRDAIHATGVGAMLSLAARLAERGPDPHDTAHIAGAARFAGAWAHSLLERIGAANDADLAALREPIR